MFYSIKHNAGKYNEYEEDFEEIISAKTEEEARQKIPKNAHIDIFHETTEDAKL